jgi:hypothetical protein
MDRMRSGRYVLEKGRGVTTLVYEADEAFRVASTSRPRCDSHKAARADSVQVAGRRALARLRRAVAALPVEMLGERPLWITLTVPGDWRRWVPDQSAWESMRRAMVDRWEYRYGRLLGIWVREFQESGAPHMHWYVACPAAVDDRDYGQLVRRTLLAKELEESEGKTAVPVIGLAEQGPFKGEWYGGRFAMWLRRAWSETVTAGRHGAHYARGVDVRTSYWSQGAARQADKVRVLSYMAGEMGKPGQKRVPYGFGEVRRWWGLFGRDLGFSPKFEYQALEEELGRAVAVEMEAWVRGEIVRRNPPARATEILANRDRRLEWHGVEALGLYGSELEQLLARAEAQAEQSAVDVWG